MKYLSLILLSLLLVFLLNQSVFAQSDTAVRSELTSLSNRISRLESQIGRLGSGSRTPVPSYTPRQPSSPPRVVNGEIIGESDPMFERLATLVIEIREDVRNLDKRMKVLEAREQGR
jgi:BMFP domain-containing protein YqiC